MRNSFYSKRFLPYITVFFCSILFSAIAFVQDSFINSDAIPYLDAAKAFLRDGFFASFAIYPWPFYSILLASAQQVAGVPLELMAYIINASLIAISCVLFLKIYHEITNGKGSVWLAGILILSFTGINKYRDDIMRDFGYWCAFFSAFLCILHFYKKPSWRSSFGWQFFISLAFLFRIEAIALIFMGPFVVFLKKDGLKERFSQVFNLFSLFIVASLIFCVTLKIGGANLDIPYGRVSEILSYLAIDKLLYSFNEAVSRLGHIFFYDGLHIDKYYLTLVTVMVVAMFVYLIIKILTCFTIPYSLAFFYGFYKKSVSLSIENKVVIYFIFTQAVVLVLFLSQKFLLTPRYATIFAFMLILLLGQMIERNLPYFKQSSRFKWFRAIVVIILFIQILDSLISVGGTSKHHLKMAGEWVRDNVVPKSKVYSNDKQALYYTDRGTSGRYWYPNDADFITAIKLGKIKSPSYVIAYIRHNRSVELGREISILEKNRNFEKIKEFNNERNDKAVIYRAR